MEFENETRLPAELMRAQLFYQDLLMSTVVCKATFQVQPDGTVSLATDQQALTVEDQDTPLGLMPSDMVPIKQGCDLSVYGHACAPGLEAPAPNVRVQVRVGGCSRALLVSGDRRWEMKEQRARPSRGQPFLTFPLHYRQAFGGKTAGPEGFEHVWHDNPDGKGLIAEDEEPNGKMLPNIEEADQLVSDPRDRPLMACLGALPRHSALRGARGLVVDIDQQTTQMLPLAFNCAHPRMLLDSYPAGERVQIEGMTSASLWTFVLPRLDLQLSVDLGGRQHTLRLRPDSLAIFPSTGMFTVVARRAFIYQFVAERQRTIRVAWGDPHARVEEPADSISRLKSGQGSGTVPVVAFAEQTFSMDTLIPYYALTTIIESLPVCASD